MMKHVIYFHGFASSPKSSKAIELAKHFSVFVPSVPYVMDDERLVQEIKTYLIEKVSIGDKIIFCGTSLGGFFAVRLGYAFDVPVLAINPSVDPFQDLQQYIGTNINYSTREEFILTAADVGSFCDESLCDVEDYNVTALVCKNDPVIPAERSIQFFEKVEVIDSDDHQFNDDQKIIDTLNDMFDNGPVDNFCEGDFL